MEEQENMWFKQLIGRFRSFTISAAPLAGLALVVPAAPANADIINVDYSGVITSEQNDLGLPLGGVNALFTGSFVIDTSKGGLTTGGNFQEIEGGTGSYIGLGTMPIISAAFADGSYSYGTLSSLGSDFGFLLVGINGSTNYWASYTSSNAAYGTGLSGAAIQQIQIIVPSPVINEGFAQDFLLSGFNVGSFNLISDVFGCASYGCLQTSSENGTITQITVHNATTSAIPEPFTLSLFGAGLFGVAAMRKRKART
jgi:hypothetical protein